MVVGDHGPEAPQRFRRDGDAKLRDIALQKTADEFVAPDEGFLIARGEIGAREAAAVPEAGERVRAGLAQREAAQVHDARASGQRFGNPADDVR